jgi:hypothetical protein
VKLRVGAIVATVVLSFGASAASVAAAQKLGREYVDSATKVLLNDLRYKPYGNRYKWIEGEEFQCYGVHEYAGLSTKWRCSGIVWANLDQECVETVSENYCEANYKTCRFVTTVSPDRAKFARLPYACKSERLKDH